jgi:hypothetical protein
MLEMVTFGAVGRVVAGGQRGADPPGRGAIDGTLASLAGRAQEARR